MLTLIPTPLDEETPLEPVALARLAEAAKAGECVIVEDLKVARRRWLRWGLPREAVDRFEILDEHTEAKGVAAFVTRIRAGEKLYLMSDCGLPAFCDPGQTLVDACHRAGARVTATPFPHSVALALALSGYDCDRYTFLGFPPREEQARKKALAEAARLREAAVLMDTPYRLVKLVEELGAALKDAGTPNRGVFLACDLNQPAETCLRATAPELVKAAASPEPWKREFVIVLEPKA